MRAGLFQGQQTPALTLAWRARDGMEFHPGSIIYVPMEFKGFLSMEWSILSPNPEMAWPGVKPRDHLAQPTISLGKW